jgi:rod shape-determining protein MreC
VQPGDLLVTSGLDGVYQPGLPVAKVVRVDRDAAYSFARIPASRWPASKAHGQVLILGAREPAAAPGRGNRTARQAAQGP